jgi:hypothetical protein
MLVRWELGSLISLYILYFSRYESSFVVNPLLLFGLIKEEAWQLWTKAIMVEWDNNIFHLPFIHLNNWTVHSWCS